MKKRISALLLCCVLAFCSIDAYASEMPDDATIVSLWDEMKYKLQYLANSMGALITFDRDWAIKNETLIDWLNNMNDGKYYWYEYYGDSDIPAAIYFTDECMDTVKEIADQYIEEQSGGGEFMWDYGDYYIYKTMSYDDLWECINNDSSFSNLWYPEKRNSLIDYMNKYDYLYVYKVQNGSSSKLNVGGIQGDIAKTFNYVASSQFTCYYIPTAKNEKFYKVNIYDNNGALTDYEITDGVSIYYVDADAPDGSFTKALSESDYFIQPYVYGHGDRNIITRSGENIRIWKSTSKMNQFMSGMGTKYNYAITTNYINYDKSIDNSYKTNIQTINNIQNNYNSYLNEINETINNINNYNTSNVTYNEYQTYVDNSVTNIINNYYYGDDTGGSGDGSVSGNSPTLDSDAFYDEEGKSWFEKIHTRLEEILDKLKEIKRWLVGDVIMDGVGSLAELFLDLKDGIQDMVDNMTDLIPDISDLAEDLVEIGEDKITDIVTDVGDTFAPTGALLKTKFPFCIPWDLIAITTVMVADAKPPVYEFPFVIESIGFSHTVVLDMSIWEPVAKMCRKMLCLLFVLVLMHLTIKLTSRGDGEE